ncbi:MAG: TonB C-terminal domain-containing protein [Pseudomonadales bacterium]|nr:TonB C-terminal domain-containing protein [Pseudomonadales bacterium]
MFFAVGVGVLIKHYLTKDIKEPKKVVQQITIVAPPPPPPPPPPEEEPEPEVEEEVVEEPVEESMPDEPMDQVAGEDLGMEGDGAAGSDGFGLVARKGGRGLLGGGSSYAADVQAEITDWISADDSLRYQEYSAVLKLWIDEMGVVERFELDQRSGNPEAEKRLKQLLASLDRFKDGPPLEMPQPIKLRIRSQL